MRTVAWFSAGAASAVAAKIAVDETDGELVVAYVDPGSEHSDNLRFISDVESWLDVEIVRLKSERYADTWAVWEHKRFIKGPNGAPCTTELKKRVRFGFQEPTDRQVFGYTTDEKHRAVRFADENPGVDLWCPLIDKSYTKQDCLAILNQAGIEIPTMYKLGFLNNNCIGCPKGGMGYWNNVRTHFPETFDRMADLERELGFAILKDDNGSVFLDELDPQRGDMASEPDMDCSLLCHGFFIE